MSDFDFEAFIKGTQLPRRTVHVFRVDHRDEIDRLTREHDALPPEGADDRLASRSQRRDLAERIAAMRGEMDGSRVEFTIRTLTPDEFKRLQDDDDLDVYAQLEWQSVEPKLTAQQWRQIADAVGVAQFQGLVQDANDLVLSRVAVPDFSPSVSETLSPPQSSGN